MNEIAPGVYPACVVSWWHHSFSKVAERLIFKAFALSEMVSKWLLIIVTTSDDEQLAGVHTAQKSSFLSTIEGSPLPCKIFKFNFDIYIVHEKHNFRIGLFSWTLKKLGVTINDLFLYLYSKIL